jgi:hypothetical protein
MATTKTATRKQTEIQQPVVFRCTSKQSGEVFYMIRSDSDPNTYYEQHWNEERRQWMCNCPATKPCKHERAVSEVCKERRQYHQEVAQPATSTEQVCSEPFDAAKVLEEYSDMIDESERITIDTTFPDMHSKLTAMPILAAEASAIQARAAPRREEARREAEPRLSYAQYCQEFDPCGLSL